MRNDFTDRNLPIPSKKDDFPYLVRKTEDDDKDTCLHCPHEHGLMKPLVVLLGG